MVLACHVMSQDYVIRGSCDFMGGQPIKVSYHPAKLGGHNHFGSEIIMNLVCHVIL